MECGTILFDSEFKFSDGSQGEKLLAVLSDGEEGHHIIVKTTSKAHYKGIEFGCQIKERYPNFYLPKGSCVLKEHTWIQLDQYFEFSSSEFLIWHFSGRINRIGVLPNEITIKVLHCAIESEDVSNRQRDVLIQMVEQLQGRR